MSENYSRFKLFLDDAIEMSNNNRFREFILVFHNYIDDFLYAMLIKEFVRGDKINSFKQAFEISEITFKRKIIILKNAGLIPLSFFKVLDDFNDIRNAVAHNID